MSLFPCEPQQVLTAFAHTFKLECCKDVEIDFYDDEFIELKRNQETNRILFVKKHKNWLIKYKGKAVKRQRRPKQII